MTNRRSVIVHLMTAMVVVATAANYGQYSVWKHIREQLVPKVMQAALPRARE